MIEARLVGRHISEFASLLGYPVAVPGRPPEGDPEFGLDRYAEQRDRGFVVHVDWDDVATCVQFFSAEKEPDYSRYSGSLLAGLSFESSRAEVRRALGAPERCGDGGSAIFGIEHRPWDRFIYEGRKVHFEYRDPCDAILMVSVMTLSQV